MELSLSALQGLQVASTLPEEAYYRILNHAVRTSLEVENVKDTGAGTCSCSVIPSAALVQALHLLILYTLFYMTSSAVKSSG